MSFFNFKRQRYLLKYKGKLIIIDPFIGNYIITTKEKFFLNYNLNCDYIMLSEKK